MGTLEVNHNQDQVPNWNIRQNQQMLQKNLIIRLFLQHNKVQQE